MTAQGMDRSPRPNRRSVLLGVAGVIIGAGMLDVERHPSGPLGASRAEAVGPARAVLADATVQHELGGQLLHQSISTTIPPWARRWNHPIYDLDDFLRRDHDVHFPKRAVMLTVDDGPHPVWTPRYLRLFEKHDIRVTFNMIGEQVRANAKIVRAVASQGHVIANHTWTHDEHLPDRSLARIRHEILSTNEVIHSVTGLVPTQFRAPGGVWGPRVYDELARLRMMPVGWDVDPRDWARPGTSAIESAMLRTRRGDIVLCHDGGGDRSQTFAALQRVVPELKHRGLQFVTLP